VYTPIGQLAKSSEKKKKKERRRKRRGEKESLRWPLAFVCWPAASPRLACWLWGSSAGLLTTLSDLKTTSFWSP